MPQIVGQFIDLRNISLNKLDRTAQEKVGNGNVGELPVEIVARVLLSGDLKIENSMDVLAAEGELVPSDRQAEIIGELKRASVHVGQRASTAEGVEAVSNIDRGKVAG